MEFKYRREKIIAWLLRIIAAANESKHGVNEEKLIAECCMAFFCGERLVREILKHLKISGKIVVDFDDLYLTSYSEAIEAMEADAEKIKQEVK